MPRGHKNNNAYICIKSITYTNGNCILILPQSYSHHRADPNTLFIWFYIWWQVLWMSFQTNKETKKETNKPTRMQPHVILAGLSETQSGLSSARGIIWIDPVCLMKGKGLLVMWRKMCSQMLPSEHVYFAGDVDLNAFMLICYHQSIHSLDKALKRDHFDGGDIFLLPLYIRVYKMIEKKLLILKYL